MEEDSGSGSNVGAIVGGVIGIILLLAAAAILIFFCKNQQKACFKKKGQDQAYVTVEQREVHAHVNDNITLIS